MGEHVIEGTGDDCTGVMSGEVAEGPAQLSGDCTKTPGKGEAVKSSGGALGLL